MRKNIIKLHRVLSLLIALPVMLWAISGFMHPVMTNLRPRVASQQLQPVAVDSAKIRIALEDALQNNRIKSFSNFRLVHIDTNWFYQVHTDDKKQPTYISATTGRLLHRGDWLYAQWLARQFLEGKKSPNMQQAPGVIAGEGLSDCCDAAAAIALNDNGPGAKVRQASLVKTFNEEYKDINRLLPVYKVDFDRSDGIRIYVETAQDRFALAMDNNRAAFDTIFQLFHTWAWLDILGKGKLIVIILIASLAFLTAVLGISIFIITRSKPAPGNAVVKARRNHRYTAIVAVAFTLSWTFSGAYHAFSKFKDDTRNDYFIVNHFASDNIHFDLQRLQQTAADPILNTSLVKIGQDDYWQVFTQPLMEKQSAAIARNDMNPQPVVQSVSYINTRNYAVLEDGEAIYARWMATVFSKHPVAEIQSATPVLKFTDEYNFTDKRLPVWKVSYAGDNNDRYYVETKSGKLASRVDDRNISEGYSFALLHKHHFMDWGGKGVRDFSTMFWAAVQVVMALAGLILYFRRRRRIKNKVEAV